MCYFRNNPLKKCLFSLSPLFSILLYSLLFQFEVGDHNVNRLLFKNPAGSFKLVKEAGDTKFKVDSLPFSVNGLANEDLLMKFFEGDYPF